MMSGYFKMMKFGTLKYDGVTLSIPDGNNAEEVVASTTQYHGGSIEITDTEQGKEIQWIYIPDMDIYVADRCLISYLSWNVLHLMGYTEGKRISVDGKVYNCRLMHTNLDKDLKTEWDKILEKAPKNDEFWNIAGTCFWGDGAVRRGSERRLFCSTELNLDVWEDLTKKIPASGFRPVLEPVFADKKPRGIAGDKIDIVCFGTLLLDGATVFDVGRREVQEWNGEDISFRDTKPGKGISWLYIKEKGYFISQRCLLTNISWQDLFEQGFAYGKKIRINEREYYCRLPIVDMENPDNEWDSVVSLFNQGREAAFPTRKMYSWGLDSQKDSPDEKIIRGYCSPTSWSSIDKECRDARIGVRFVLELPDQRKDLNGI